MGNDLMAKGNTIFQRSGYLVSDMDGDKVMMGIDTGKYYNLGKVGGRIWELVSTPVTVTQLVDALASEYDIDRELCEEQVISFLTRLSQENLIHIEEASV
ncbi:lasso peptide biosynthesis PqqD family chaperone [Paenibacillus timonensis]|uniref:Lasso peptide biosynthesis PqqD family chaperone n=1 Tax=Paenibacillus timonensis TaxID=225915 RepID=A0ABW3SC59_9BACL|nr:MULTISPECIES: lasso peptide biosynthesis PqqD family chaperone [Paenibacillus]MCH1640131.1 lasso peptide biosynthesis PqqD family chaperone [Paenibacillus timonensis]MDU2239836.1 lasso peptide biosynthesis PqqD family chaperone [Paenibacillus sp.]